MIKFAWIFLSLILLSTPSVSLAADVDVSATVDREPPNMTIKFPLDGSDVVKIVQITTVVTDDSGIAKVEFYIDGFLKLTDTTTPFSFSWDSQTSGNGSHIIRVTVTDLVGKTAEDSITVIVANKTTEIPLPPVIETPEQAAQPPSIDAPSKRTALVQDPVGYVGESARSCLVLGASGEKISKCPLFGVNKDTLLGFLVGTQLAIVLFLLYLLKHLHNRHELKDKHNFPH